MSSQKNVLETVIDYSLELTYLIQKKKIKIDDIYSAFIMKQDDFLFHDMVPIEKKDISKLKKKYSKFDCFDEILNDTDHHYFHLKNIRYLVDISEMVETVITEPIYLEKLKIYYADSILDQLVEKFYDLDSIKFLGKLKRKVFAKNKKIQERIKNNIDRYYMKKIIL